MKIVIASNGKKTIKISKSEWQQIGKTAGWDFNVMDSQTVKDMDDKTDFDDARMRDATKELRDKDRLVQDLKARNYYMYKMEWPWGKMPAFENKNDRSDRKYILEGKVMTWEEVKNWVKENWRPVHSDDKQKYEAIVNGSWDRQ